MRTACARNRRKHDRVRLNPMYTSVIVEPKRAVALSLLGHAYDISETGVRIELDEPLRVGQSVSLHLELPGAPMNILADADVMWVNDAQDDPGPRRMALRFTGFAKTRDKARLHDWLSRSVRSLAA